MCEGYPLDCSQSKVFLVSDNICDVYMMRRERGNMKTMVPMLLVVLGIFCCSHVSQAIICHECTSCSWIPTAKCGEPFEKQHSCTDDREDAVCFKYKISEFSNKEDS